MLEMGFEKNRSVRALHFSEAETVEQAINWIVENEDAEDLDEPLFVKPKKPMTQEEKLERVEQLRRDAKERREKEEKQSEIVRERERIRMGKEMQAALQKEKEQERQRMIEQRKREQEQDKVAKEKIRAKLEEDRRERRRKLGLPEELTEEEKHKEEEKKALKAKEEAERLTKHVRFVKPVGATEKLRSKLVEMKQNTDDAAFNTACGILIKYIGNVRKNPNDEKFRKIKLTNAAFVQKVAPVKGSIEFLESCGFSKGLDPDFLILQDDKMDLELLDAAGTVINSAMTNPFFGAL
eukprot:g665.t1